MINTFALSYTAGKGENGFCRTIMNVTKATLCYTSPVCDSKIAYCTCTCPYFIAPDPTLSSSCFGCMRKIATLSPSRYGFVAPDPTLSSSCLGCMWKIATLSPSRYGFVAPKAEMSQSDRCRFAPNTM